MPRPAATCGPPSSAGDASFAPVRRASSFQHRRTVPPTLKHTGLNYREPLANRFLPKQYKTAPHFLFFVRFFTFLFSGLLHCKNITRNTHNPQDTCRLTAHIIGKASGHQQAVSTKFFGGRDKSCKWIFNCGGRVGAPHPCIVQGRAVYASAI